MVLRGAKLSKMMQMLMQDLWSVQSRLFCQFFFYKIITNFTFFLLKYISKSVLVEPVLLLLTDYFIFTQASVHFLKNRMWMFATSGRLTRSEHRELLKGHFRGKNTGVNCKYSPILNWPQHALTNAALKMTTKILITFLIQTAGREEKGNKKEGTGESRTGAPAQPTTRLDGM